MDRRPELLPTAWLWPAVAAVSAGEAASAIARGLVGLALGPPEAGALPEPLWATPNRIALELRSGRLRDFSRTQEGPAALVCAPFALHGASIADFAPGHSMVAALLEAGLHRVFVTDWRSAAPDMRFFSIDTYLADLNVLVDHMGGSVDLIGLCQGGWMALLYAARFPAKVRKLVVAGAPIDIAADDSFLSRIACETPLAVFRELVELGEGRVLGRHALQFWGPIAFDREAIHQVLQPQEPLDSPRFRDLETRFRDWYRWTVDLPGTYYLEVVERLFKDNQLAAGRFVALGERIDLGNVRNPMFLLAARDDALIAPAQLFAAERLVGTPTHDVRKTLAPCSHLGLFMGRPALAHIWPRIARWLALPRPSERRHPWSGAARARHVRQIDDPGERPRASA
jgi:poly(3-hydroxyalkanoate) synthetase